MSYIQGWDRRQPLLLPEQLEEYVSAANEVRFVDAFVEGLDLGTLGIAEHDFGAAGRPPYDPRDLIKLYMWGYLNRVRSSRRLEQACGRDLEVIWLLRKVRPDHKTISEFRRVNRKAFGGLLKAFNLLCRQLGLFGAELVAIDGAMFKAVNSKARNYTQPKLKALLAQVEKRIEEWLAVLETSDQEGESRAEAKAGTARELKEKIAGLREKREQLEGWLKQVEQTGEQVSLTDPDSRLMSKGGEGVVGYNVQMAVDAKHKLIVDVEATQAGNDREQLASSAERAKDALGVEKLSVLADKGYFNIAELKRCEAAGITARVPVPKTTKPGDGSFPSEAFRYEADQDVCVCPAGQTLGRHADAQRRNLLYQTYYNVAACTACAQRAQCTRGRYRKIVRLPDQAWLDRMRQTVQDRPEWMRQRAALVEHPFGSLKHWMGLRDFLLRTRQKVQAEISLGALAYNLRRALHVLGLAPLLAAV